jgi:hypothetical protein
MGTHLKVQTPDCSLTPTTIHAQLQANTADEKVRNAILLIKGFLIDLRVPFGDPEGTGETMSARGPTMTRESVLAIENMRT